MSYCCHNGCLFLLEFLVKYVYRAFNLDIRFLLSKVSYHEAGNYWSKENIKDKVIYLAILWARVFAVYDAA
jgi:hypothetical protein